MSETGGDNRALRQAGVAIAAGLAVQVVTLVWSHPTAFLVFIGAGGLLVAAGMLRYLGSLLASPASPPPAADDPEAATPAAP